jgi:primosomal protein N' (replication factor Y)
VGFYLGPAARDSGPGGRGGIKAVESFVDEAPAFPASMMEFLLKAAAYYHYPEGLVLKTAMGPGEGLKGKLHYVATKKGRELLEQGGLREIERRIVELAARSAKSERQLRRSVPLLTPDKLAGMLEERLIEETESGRRPAPRSEERLCLLLEEKEGGQDDGNLTGRQKEILASLSIRDGVTAAALKRSLPATMRDIFKLKREGYIRIEEISSELCLAGDDAPLEPEKKIELSDAQKTACAALDGALVRGEFETFLLFGITGSGKTEVYLRTIMQALKLGRSSVVIVPEIALTPQLLGTFRRRIGETVAVIHSGLGASARRREIRGIAEGTKRVVVGARSALFSLAANPGVFVVDEEHDGSLKQEEGFRYSARDMAILRAREEGALAILASATPSIESFYNAASGKYRLLTLPERVSPNPLPAVELINERRHLYGPQKQRFISMPLYRAISETLGSGGQIILFLNRRGYAPVSLCKECGQTVRCPDCSISLTYHRFTSRLSCHHCGYSQSPVTTCPSCGAADAIVITGPGTERIEEVVSGLFPSARVVRMDSDVASGMASEPILRRLREGKADILVGTQMITKGHDLPKVALVGVIRADAELNFPDFRASEKTFSVLTQVAGRAGRGPLPGRVILQTFNPHHPAIEAAVKQNYAAFYGWEIRNRKNLFYPPFAHLALIRLEGMKEERIVEEGQRLAGRLRAAAASGRETFRVLGPAPSPLARIRRRFRWQILVRWTRSSASATGPGATCA